MERRCPSCRRPAGANDRFCAQCGTELRTVDAPSPNDTPPSRPPADEAPTESVPTVKAGDTSVLPAAPPVEPYVAPRPTPRAAEPEGGAPRRRGVPLGAMFALVGAVAVILSALLAWTRATPATFPRDVAAGALLGRAGEGPSVGLVLVAAGTAGALVALLTMVAPILKFLRRLVGLATLAVPVLFVVRVVKPGLAELPTLVEVLGVGVYLAAGGAFLQVVAGRWFRR